MSDPRPHPGREEREAALRDQIKGLAPHTLSTWLEEINLALATDKTLTDEERYNHQLEAEVLEEVLGRM